MTDRYKGAVVVFERDIREDDAEQLLKALGMIKGVASVSPSIAEAEDYMNRQRVHNEIQKSLYNALNEVFRSQAEKCDNPPFHS